MTKITKRTVDAAGKAAERYIIWDEAIKGFGLLVLPSGVKSYLFEYRNAQRRKRRITIGKHGGDSGWLTPDIARETAGKYARQVAEGGDPLADKQAMRNALTVNDLLDRYLESDAFSKKAETTQGVDRGRIAHHLRPTLGKLLLPALSKGDVKRAHKAIANGATSTDRKSEKKHGRISVRGGEGTARMAIRLFRSILGWGAREEIIPTQIAERARDFDIGSDAIRKTIVGGQEDYATMFKELERMCDPTRIKEDERVIRRVAADAIRVIALTGARRGEITGLRWEHVDLKAGTLTLPPEAHKTGRKTGDDRVIGLPSVAAAIIASQPKGKPADLVFAPAREGKQMDLSKPWRQLRKAAKLPETIGLHGLRHSLATHMARGGAEAAEIMAALGHRDIATSQKYIHWARDWMQELAERAAAPIVSALSGNAAGGEDDNVVNMRARRARQTPAA